MTSFQLIFRTPFKTLVDSQIDWLVVDTAWWRVQIFSHHATLTDRIPFSFIRFRYEKKEYNYFIRSGILHVDNTENKVEILCLFANEVDKTIHTTVQEHLTWIKEQIALGDTWVRRIGTYERTFLENQDIALNKQLLHANRVNS